MQSIGKTTCKARTAPKPSKEATQLRNERKAMKKRFEEETNYERKGILLKEYISKQNELKARVENDDEERIKTRFGKMMNEGVNGFWKERKMMMKDETDEWLIMKNEEGKRIHDPEVNKETIAKGQGFVVIEKEKLTEKAEKEFQNVKLDTPDTTEALERKLQNKLRELKKE